MKKLALVLLFLSALAMAQGTRTWQQSTFDEFEKGTVKGVAIRSDGALELAPAFQPLFTTPSTYIWSITTDAKGNVYLAAGAPARVYKVTPRGAATVVFEPKELQVQALVADKNGVLYAGTSPDGKVYRIEPGGKPAPEKPAPDAEKKDEAAPPKRSEVPVDPSYTASVFFEPKTKYIWDLALDKEGRLYVATGDRGEVFRVAKNGQGSVFFKSDEAHIRALAFDKDGNLIAGSDGSGLVYRISPAGEGFVLYSAPKKEITAVAVDKDGNIYAAGVGEKRTGQPPSPIPMQPSAAGFTFSATATANPQQPGQQQQQQQPGQQQQQPPPPMFFPSFGAGGGSEIYQVAPDGSPRRLWGSRDDIIYSLTFDGGGRLLAGSGNKGRVFVVQPNGDFTNLLKASATQVTGFAKAPDGGLYASTSNLGKVFVVGSQPENEGVFESDVFDARIFSRWGRAEVRSRGNVELYARSGNVDNPDRNWSPWVKLDPGKDAALDVPPARFIQWRAVLRPGSAPPRLESVTLYYRPKNVAPVVTDVWVQVGARFQQMPRQQGGGDDGPIQVGDAPQRGPQAQQPRMEFAPPAFRDPDSVAFRWAARDENDDDLVYALYYRGDGETNWKLLKDKLTDKYYSTETALLPDGGYTVRVVASDEPAHSPDDALSGEKESARFELDSTPPVISDLAARLEGSALNVVFRAADTFSTIARAEYSVDAGEWRFVEPVGQLSDSRAEHYDFTVPLPAGEEGGRKRSARDPAEHVVVVRVYDRFGNLAAAKTVVRAK